MTSEWFLRSGTTVTGPMTTDQLKAMGKSGRVVEGMEVAKSASGPWHRASAVSGLVVVPATPTPVAAVHSPEPSRHTTIVVEGQKAKHVTTEGTRKFIKIQQLIAFVMLLCGLGLIVAGAQTVGGQGAAPGTGGGMLLGGVLMFTVAVAWRIVLRVLKWWHHD